MATAAVDAHSRIPEYTKQPHLTIAADDKEPQTVDDLVRARAHEAGHDEPILAYPTTTTTFDYYTPLQLNLLAEDAARHYSTVLPLRRTADDPVHVVGLLGPSTFEYLLTLLAITKLGHTVLFLSTRITEEAYVHLLQRTKARVLLVDTAFESIGSLVTPQVEGLRIASIAGRAAFVKATAQSAPLSYSRQASRESSRIAWIIHSSGSTGLPKPIFQTQKAAIQNYASNFNMRGFITLPLYHAHGISCTFRSIHSKKMIYMYSADVPLTSKYLINTLKNNQISILYGVPYALKLLAETEEGLQALAKLEIVMFGGSACPKPIGDKLVSNGVRLVSHYGSTETGQLMTSFRPRDDADWDYVRPADNLKPFLLWEERYPDIYELIVRDGWPSKVMSNRDDGGYATQDLFEKHPTKRDAWRYYARLDDTITLVTGEKANPLLVEGVAREHRYVMDAIAFGTGKTRVGLFIVPSIPNASSEQVIDGIWPAIDATNISVPAYARLSRDMIKVLPSSVQYRKTDKGTVIRAAFYRDFAAQIEQAYEESSGSVILKLEELLEYLHLQISNVSNGDGTPILDDTDLFSLGIDSLQAAQIRRAITTHLSIGGHTLGQNFVYDFPNINAMAQEILRLQSGIVSDTESSVEDRMQTLISKYSTFGTHVPTANSTSGQHIIVTGATGSLGSHIVSQLALRPDVSAIYCLVRASSALSARDRVFQSLQSRRCLTILPTKAQDKILCYSADLSQPFLGLSAAVYGSITQNLNAIIHSAWAVNFNMGLSSFESCLAGVQNLINTALAAAHPTPASFNFCSSVSAVASTPSRFAPESLPASLSHAQGMGYAQSKLVAEHLCTAATQKAAIPARVLRIGQVIGDTVHGIWNTTEAIPLMLQSATTIGALPTLNESPAWLPVDVVARCTVEITLSTAPGRVFNIVNHERFHWTRDLLPALKDAGLQFEELPQRDWIERLSASNSDAKTNPPYKLLEFWEGKYGGNNVKGSSGLTYDTTEARRCAPSLNNAKAVGYDNIRAFVEYFVKEGWVRSGND